MNVNPLRSKWKAGKTVVGTFIMYSRDIATIEIAASAGLDFILFDLEHRPHDPATIHDLCQVARLAGMAPLVGPKTIEHHAIAHALDLGASGVVIPHVETPNDVAVAIDAVRYPPKGKRGYCGTAGHNLYAGRTLGGSMSEQIENYNNDVSLLLKVESEAALLNLDELVASDGVDGVMIGPADLSVDMGIPGQIHHERIAALTAHAKDVCRKRNIHYGAFVSTVEAGRDAVADGATWVVVGSEMDSLSALWNQAADLGSDN